MLLLLPTNFLKLCFLLKKIKQISDINNLKNCNIHPSLPVFRNFPVYWLIQPFIHQIFSKSLLCARQYYAACSSMCINTRWLFSEWSHSLDGRSRDHANSYNTGWYGLKQLLTSCRKKAFFLIALMEGYTESITFGLALKNEHRCCRGKACRTHVSGGSICMHGS